MKIKEKKPKSLEQQLEEIKVQKKALKKILDGINNKNHKTK